MEKIDYSLLGTIYLNKTGFLSNSSIELRKFISDNGIYTVGSFLESIDNNTYSVATYNDTMNEARGMADILRNKYFNTSVYSDLLFESEIVETEFDIPSGSLCMLGIKINNRKKMTIYTVINRLGFNDKERSQILDKYYNKLQGNTLLNIFKEILDSEDYKRNNLSEEDKVFYNKISFYVEYSNKKVNYFVRNKLKEDLDALMTELGELLTIKDDLEKQISIIKQNIGTLEDGIRGIKI